MATYVALVDWANQGVKRLQGRRRSYETNEPACA
jgi:uncharacterized protein with GYD domain